MARRVVLHIGLMKTGTSYLQRRLQTNRRLLRGRGVLFPSPWRFQVLAVSDGLGRRRTFSGESDGRWAALVERVRDFAGETVVVSMEFLGPARPDRIAALVADLQGTGADVEVVMTLRDLGRGVPAMWQESLKNGGHVPWTTYVGGLDGSEPHAKGFWRQQGAARVAGNWTDVVGRDRFTVVTVPPPGADPDALWDRFCEAVGISGAGCAEIEPANESLGAASAQVLAEVNRRIGDDGVDWIDYNRVLKMGVAKGMLPRRRADEEPIGYAPSPWLVDRAARMSEALRSSGLRVVGDLDDLVPQPVRGVDPDLVPLADVHETALWLLTELVRDGLRESAERRSPAP